MKRMSSKPRGFSLVVAMIVVVLLTLLVVGAIAFTGTERSAAVLHSSSEALSSCAQSARDLFIAQTRVLQGKVVQTLDTSLGSYTVQSRHYDGGVSISAVKMLPQGEMSGELSQVSDISNRVGQSGLLAHYYQVTAVCQDGTTGAQKEVEFVVRVGL